MVSGSCACTSIGNPKSVGRFPLTSRHDSPASSLRMTSQCFCMNSTPGRDGCIAMRWTQWPTSAFGSGICSDLQAAVDRPPRLAGVVGPEHARRRDGDEDPPGMARIQQDRVQAHPAGARLPGGRRAVAAQSGELLPRLAAVGRAEQGGVFHPGVDGVRIGQRRFEMPDALELPGVRRAVVPLVRAGDAVVHELVPHRLPRLAAVVGALDHLPEPAAGLRRIQPIRVGGRSLEVVDLPAGKVGTTDVPPFALAVRRQDERALARANQYPYPAHPSLLPEPRARLRRAAPSGRRDQPARRADSNLH